MPEYAHMEYNRITFEGTDGQLYELRGLPLTKRDLFVKRWIEWKLMLGDVEDLAGFIAKYDRLKVDGTPNPELDGEFRKATEWLLKLIVATDPLTDERIPLIEVVDAEAVVGLLISKDGEKSVIEQIEFPEKKVEATGDKLPDHVDGTTHLKAALMSHCDGDLIKAEQIASTLSYGEMTQILDESNRLMEKSRKELENPRRSRKPEAIDELKLTDKDKKALADEFFKDAQNMVLAHEGIINGTPS